MTRIELIVEAVFSGVPSAMAELGELSAEEADALRAFAAASKARLPAAEHEEHVERATLPEAAFWAHRTPWVLAIMAANLAGEAAHKAAKCSMRARRYDYAREVTLIEGKKRFPAEFRRDLERRLATS